MLEKCGILLKEIFKVGVTAWHQYKSIVFGLMLVIIEPLDRHV
jgi:hypothetical protein